MDIKLLSIDTIGLSVRSTNALHRAEVHTVGDMLKHSEKSLSEIRNLGEKSIKEITEKIKEYKRLEEGGLPDEHKDMTKFEIPEDFEKWLKDPVNQSTVIDWLKEKDIKIESVELLSTRAFNLLMFARYDYIHQITFLTQNQLLDIPRMDGISASEIEKLVYRYIVESKEEIFDYLNEKSLEFSEPKPISIYDLLYTDKYHDIIRQYVVANDVEIERLGLSNRPKNRLISKGYTHLSDIIFMTRSEFQKIPSMGVGSIEEIIDKINEYLTLNETRIIAVISGDESALWDDEAIKRMILSLYCEIGFNGLSLNDIVTRLQLPEQITIERLKRIIGRMITDKELEYVDYRCYRIYGKFEDYLTSCPDIDERSRDFIDKRLKGKTLEAIAKDNDISRERVRQIVKSGIEKIRNYYSFKIGMNVFDEEYYRYLYETYEYEK